MKLHALRVCFLVLWKHKETSAFFTCFALCGFEEVKVLLSINCLKKKGASGVIQFCDAVGFVGFALLVCTADGEAGSGRFPWSRWGLGGR